MRTCQGLSKQARARVWICRTSKPKISNPRVWRKNRSAFSGKRVQLLRCDTMSSGQEPLMMSVQGAAIIFVQRQTVVCRQRSIHRKTCPQESGPASTSRPVRAEPSTAVHTASTTGSDPQPSAKSVIISQNITLIVPGLG